MKDVLSRLAGIDDSPEKIAAGTAIGVAMGILPTFGVGTFLAIGVSYITKSNKISAILGSAVMNPWVAPFFWALSFGLGGFVLGKSWKELSKQIELYQNESLSFMELLGKDILLPYMVGNLLLTLLLAFASYLIVLKIVLAYREKRSKYKS